MSTLASRAGRRVIAATGAALLSLALAAPTSATPATVATAATPDTAGVVRTSDAPSLQRNQFLAPRKCKTVGRSGSAVEKRCTQRLNFRGQAKLQGPNLCVRWSAGGVYKWNIAGSRQRGWVWNKFRFDAAKVAFRGYTITGCESPVETRKRIGRAKFSWLTYGASSVSCDLNPSLAVSFPWAVTVGAAPECGRDARRGRWSDSTSPRGGSQYISFKDRTRSRSLGYGGNRLQNFSGPICFRTSLGFTVANESRNRSARFGPGTRYCIDPTPRAGS